MSQTGGLVPPNPPNELAFPVLIASRGYHVYVAWIDVSVPPLGNREVFFSRSTEGGLTFSPAINLSQTPTLSQFGHLVVGADGSINITWQEDGQPNREILCRRSVDGGITFSTTKNLSQDPTGARFNLGGGGDMVVDGNSIFPP